MKKSELTQLTQIIEHLVRREIKKQLPGIIAETFQNMMGKPRETITEQIEHVRPNQDNIVEEEEVLPAENNSAFKASLRELFAGNPVIRRAPESVPSNGPRPMRHFTKDPKINAILNETVSDLRSRESMVGMAAFQGGYNPSVAMAPGMMMESVADNDPPFMKNAPSMPMPNNRQPTPMNHVPSIPISRPPVLVEGQESNHAPLAEVLPEGVSALDVAREVPLAQPVAQALTRNYSQMMKLIDQKKGKK
jgi:hypothetical protein